MKTNKKKSSARRKLLPAVAMLTVSAVSLSSATYAWFTMNKQVTVTGMMVKTKVGSNLLITEDSYNLTTTTDNQDSKYTTAIAQIRQCLLEPSSTTDGVNYHYTVEASADGKKLSGATYLAYNESSGTSYDNDVAGKLAYDTQFNNKYTIEIPSGGFAGDNGKMTANQDGAAYGYIDYTFYIKATSDTDNQHVSMTECNLLYNNQASALSGTGNASGAVPNIDRAWRVALLVQDATQNSDISTAPATTDLITILKPQYAVNQTAGYAVDSNGTVSAYGAEADAYANFASIGSSGTTKYYRVTVRMWLEGEDTTCTSETYAKLTNDYRLELGFELKNSGENGINQIDSVVGKTVASGTLFN